MIPRNITIGVIALIATTEMAVVGSATPQARQGPQRHSVNQPRSA
jgi:hypothetical protein